MKKRHFVFVYDKILIEEIYEDFSHDERVTVTQNLRNVHSQLLRFLRKVHFSAKINRIIPLPLKSIWSYNLKNISWNTEFENYVIFVSSAIFPMSIRRLLKIKEKWGIHFVLLMADDWNSLYAKRAHHYVSSVPFDYIFSFDPRDVERNHLHYTFVPYSKLSDNSEELPQYDLFYIGTIGNMESRLKTVIDIYEQSCDSRVDVKFILTDVKKSREKYADKIVYGERMSYASSLEYTKKTNCILELLRETQSGATLRYYEAVCYNKKLLTNNKDVVNLPFYNPEYMHVFEKPEDIDWEWVKERIPVDYHYDGRFSPTHLIDRIIELEEEKEKQENAEEEAH